MSWNTCQFDECEAYTARPDGDYCESHRRANLKAEQDAKKNAAKFKAKLSTPFVPRKPPKKVSNKRKVLNLEYGKLAEQFKIDNPECKARINEHCTKATDDVHHSRGRGNYLLDVATWIPVCRSCHVYIGDNPLDAFKRGLSFSRLEKKETI